MNKVYVKKMEKDVVVVNEEYEMMLENFMLYGVLWKLLSLGDKRKRRIRNVII